MMMKRIIAVLCLVVSVLAVRAQRIEEGYYMHPTEGTIFLSANFAEVRPNHFHSGIDIKTGGAIGKKIVAIADGYVSRVAVSSGGYGRALYVTHTNGTTSVYGHLSSFSLDVEKYVMDECYRTKRHFVNLFPEAGRFPVKKGEQIALSGNSGSSFGPHLHFEIRGADQSTWNICARKLLSTKDTILPTIARLYYFEVDTVRGVPMHSAPRPVAVKSVGAGKYSLEAAGPLSVGPRGYFAIEVTDRKNDTHNTMGVYRITQKVDGEANFSFKLDRFFFSDTRYVNAMTVYPLQRGSRNEVFMLAVQENNRMPVYSSLRNRGMISVADTTARKIEIEVEDDSGNIAAIGFEIKLGDDPQPFYTLSDTEGEVITSRHSYVSQEGGILLSVPAGALYQPVFYNPSRELRPEEWTGAREQIAPLTDMYNVLSPDIPLHADATVSLKADVPERLRAKSRFATVSDRGSYSYVGGTWKLGVLTAKTRTLGRLCIVADTIPPKVTPSFQRGADLSQASSLAFAISDNFSGIGDFTASIDGNWILLDYEPVQKRIVHYFDNTRTPRGGDHTINLTVTDRVGNRTTYSGSFKR